jgi:hypothetical protein
VLSGITYSGISLMLKGGSNPLENFRSGTLSTTYSPGAADDSLAPLNMKKAFQGPRLPQP